MKINDIVLEDGRIIPGINTTDDVGPDEIKIQAKKMGFTVTKDGVPPLLHKPYANHVDVEAIHFAEMEKAIVENQSLYENLGIQRTNTNIFNFIADYNTTPIIGESYIYCSIFAIGDKMVTKSAFKRPQKLLNIDENGYIFDIAGELKSFPESGSIDNDIVKKSALFRTVLEFNQFLSMSELKFGEIHSPHIRYLT